ncbi:lipid carrier--UDP-N-acetylgalactosaminyltransferase, partial [Clostridiaceae bacterium OM02-2AC]
EWQKHRHDVRPGLTGYAQVNGRNSISWQDKFKLDYFYIKNYNFILDLSIVIKTIFTVILHEGINSDSCATMEQFRGDKND